MTSFLVILLASFCGSKALEAGACSETTAIENLDLKSLEGKWYELSSYGAPLNHRLERCYETTITASEDGKGFVMANDRILKLLNKHIKSTWSVEGSGNGDNLSGDLKLKFKLPFIGTVSIPFKILDTDDYKNYIIFHACFSFASLFKSNVGFIFTRKRHYDASELENLYASIDETLKKNGLNRSKFSLANQINCEVEPSSSSDSNSAASSENPPADESQTTETSTSPNSDVEESSQSDKTATSESSASSNTAASESDASPDTTASESGASPDTTASESGASPDTTASESDASPDTTASESGASPDTTASESGASSDTTASESGASSDTTASESAASPNTAASESDVSPNTASSDSQ